MVKFLEIAELFLVIGVAYFAWINKDAILAMLKLPGGGPGPGGGGTGGCDPMTQYMWQIPGTKRLQVINPCLTLTGKVGRTSSAPDGDYNFDLALDSAYSRYRSTQGSHGSNVWCEMICQKPVRDSSGDEASLDKYRHACPGCNCYRGKKFSYLPKTGDHVRVSGVYVKDIREGGHMELHPVSTVSKL